MALLRTILHDLALVVLVAAGVLACLVLHKALAIEDATTGTLAGFNTALATVNTPKSGTLSMLDDTIFQGRLTIDATNKVLIHEQSQLGTLDTDIASLSGHADSTLTTLSGTAQIASTSLQAISDHLTPALDATTTTVKQVGTTMAGLQPLESDAAKTVQDGDALVTSPDVARFLKASADTGQQAAIIATQGAGIATDVHTVTRRYANPPKAKWYQKTWNVARFAAETLYDFIR
jgi:hypothetical protein